jgi:hypothetical protein
MARDRHVSQEDHATSTPRDVARDGESKHGHGRDMRGRAYTCPWWVGEVLFAMAYIEGHKLCLTLTK